MGRNGKLVLLRFLRQKPAPPPGTLRWARFLPDEKSGKESPKAGPSPALWNPPRGTGCTCVLLASALGLVGSHRWCGTSTESTYFSGRQCFYRQGLTLVSRCSQLSAAGTPLLQVRPGHENRQAVGPATRVAWCGNSNRSHTKGNGPNLDLTQAQPRTPGRSLGGNALSGFWFLLPDQKEPPAGSVPTRPEGWKREIKEEQTSDKARARVPINPHRHKNTPRPIGPGVFGSL